MIPLSTECGRGGELQSGLEEESEGLCFPHAPSPLHVARFAWVATQSKGAATHCANASSVNTDVMIPQQVTALLHARSRSTSSAPTTSLSLSLATAANIVVKIPSNAPASHIASYLPCPFCLRLYYSFNSSTNFGMKSYFSNSIKIDSC